MRRWSQQFAFILFIGFLLSVSVAPVLAQDRTDYLEDGVKLVKIGEYPARLDRIYYNIDPAQTIAIDGNQYYWVQIGKDVASDITHVWWSWLVAVVMCCGIFILSLYLVHRVVKHFIPDIIPRILKKGAARTLILKEAVIYTLPLSIVLTVLIFLAYPAVSMYVDHTTCSDFVGTVDADGCILLKVNKTSVGSDPMLLKSGVNITALKHIDGTINALVQKGVRTV